MAPRAVLFDMGNTLWQVPDGFDFSRVERMQGERVRPLMSTWGIGRLDPTEFVHELWEAIVRAYEDSILRDPVGVTFVRDAFAGQGVALSDERCGEFWRTMYISSRHFGCTLFPDTLDTLRRLRDRGLAAGIVTNRPHTADLFSPDLEEYGIGQQQVDAVVCSADVGFVKPHAAPFQRALELLDIVPADAVMVGDSLEADVGGAKALGITAVWKRNGRVFAPGLPEPDYVIDELSELLTLDLFA